MDGGALPRLHACIPSLTVICYRYLLACMQTGGWRWGGPRAASPSAGAKRLSLAASDFLLVKFRNVDEKLHVHGDGGSTQASPKTRALKAAGSGTLAKMHFSI
eukprot:781037-Amphidinium_carterae.4